MNGYLLDTHVWLWIQQNASEEVSADFFPQVEGWQRQGKIYLSAISVLEIARLVSDGQLKLNIPVERFVEVATVDGRFQLLPMTNRILIESTRLPGEIHRDPADRILASTALEHGLTLVTRDRQLLDYAKQGHLNARKP